MVNSNDIDIPPTRDSDEYCNATTDPRLSDVPISEADYERFMTANEFTKAQLDELYERHPELFLPSLIEAMHCIALPNRHANISFGIGGFA